MVYELPGATRQSKHREFHVHHRVIDKVPWEWARSCRIFNILKGFSKMSRRMAMKIDAHSNQWILKRLITSPSIMALQEWKNECSCFRDDREESIFWGYKKRITDTLFDVQSHWLEPSLPIIACITMFHSSFRRIYHVRVKYPSRNMPNMSGQTWYQG